MASNIKKWNIEQIFADRFAKYSKTIILDRALPDVRDGLKPVQRRIVYSMHLEKNIFENNFRKSAKTVGNVIANFHPHGDSSIYDAMIRMSQEWKLRENLIEIHGNNGSMDGDSPAAMRYTEARLSKISNYLVNDIDKDTVDFIPNFDDTTYEPCVLPGIFPNFLVNGGSGIAAGYATDIPPHNTREVIDTIINRIKNPATSLNQLLKTFNGPDFPTGGEVFYDTPIEEIYTRGRGKVTIFSKMRLEKKDLIVEEIPYEVNKAELVKSIDQIRLSGQLPQLKLVRDETDRNGICIRIRLDDAKNEEIVKRFLFKKTNLSKAYNFNMVGIVNNKPRTLGLEVIIDTYINHQQEVYTNKYNFLLKKYNKRMNIVNGLMKAVSILDEIIALIRKSKDKAEAKKGLQDAFEFNEEQAEAIVMMRLYRLSNTDIKQLQDEYDDLSTKISDLKLLLGDLELLNKEIIKDLKQLLKIKEIAIERKSVIIDEKVDTTISEEKLITSEDVVVTISKNSYIKRSSMKSFKSSKDLTINDDMLVKIVNANTKDVVIMFTNFGRFYQLPVHKLDDMAFKKRGNHVSSLFELQENEQVIKFMFVSDFKNTKLKVVVATTTNQIKQINLSEFEAKRPKNFIKLKDGGVVNSVFIAKQYVTCATNEGNSFTFATLQIPVSKLSGSGVKIMNIGENETTFVTSTKPNILYVFENNHYKRISHDHINVANRGTKGKLVLKKYKTSNLQLINIVGVEHDVEYVNESGVEVEKVTQFKLCDTSVKPKDFGGSFNIINDYIELVKGSENIVENSEELAVENKTSIIEENNNKSDKNKLSQIGNILKELMGEDE